MRPLRTLIKRATKVFVFGMGKLHLLHLHMMPGVRLCGKVKITGAPLVDIAQDCFLQIGNNVTLNSRNKGYHLNMFAPVKLFADRTGARITIGDNTRIHGSCLHAYNSIKVGKNCLIAANCQLIDCTGHDLSFPDVENRIHTTGGCAGIVVEDNVWIGTGSIILQGVTIGRGSVIAAHSVVTKNIPPMVLAGGNPARVIRDFTPPTVS